MVWGHRTPGGRIPGGWSLSKYGFRGHSARPLYGHLTSRDTGYELCFRSREVSAHRSPGPPGCTQPLSSWQDPIRAWGGQVSENT